MTRKIIIITVIIATRQNNKRTIPTFYLTLYARLLFFFFLLMNCVLRRNNIHAVRFYSVSLYKTYTIHVLYVYMYIRVYTRVELYYVKTVH